MIASGLKSVGSAELQVIHETPAENAAPLRTIVENKVFQQTFGGITGEQLKSAPRGFAKDHPDIDLLRYKEFMASRPFTDAEVMAGSFVEEIIVTCQALKPLTDYFADLLG